MTVAWVVCCLLEQTHTNSHDDRAGHLVGSGLLVDDASTVDNTDDAAYAQSRDTWIPLDFNKLSTKGVRGVVARVGIGAKAARFAVPIGAGKISHTQQILKWDAAIGGFAFGVNTTASHRKRRGIFLKKRRSIGARRGGKNDFN